jgi:formamidopyrimidine-DNA glycosylase
VPELAEAEFYRKRWHLAAAGDRVTALFAHGGKRVFRGIKLPDLRRALVGARLENSEARAKQILLHFSGGHWLGVHLGMSGELHVLPREHAPGRHDHLVIFTPRQALVFRDPRMFGRIRYHSGQDAPGWWTEIAPAILSRDFTLAAVTAFLRRRRRAPIKAVLLMQEQFPGIGNWMADEILWRAAIHPRRAAGSLTAAEIRMLWRESRRVCRQALRAIAGTGDHLPRDLNVNIPPTWLFRHRWQRGGRCPKTGGPLAHATIGGRTTCWSPARQPLPGTPRSGKRM